MPVCFHDLKTEGNSSNIKIKYFALGFIIPEISVAKLFKKLSETLCRISEIIFKIPQ
jgi:hypothetical protein